MYSFADCYSKVKQTMTVYLLQFLAVIHASLRIRRWNPLRRTAIRWWSATRPVTRSLRSSGTRITCRSTWVTRDWNCCLQVTAFSSTTLVMTMLVMLMIYTVAYQVPRGDVCGNLNARKTFRRSKITSRSPLGPESNIDFPDPLANGEGVYCPSSRLENLALWVSLFPSVSEPDWNILATPLCVRTIWFAVSNTWSKSDG